MYRQIKRRRMVNVSKNTHGDRFVGFIDSSLKARELPRHLIIPGKNYGNTNFVTKVRLRVNGVMQTVWLKEVSPNNADAWFLKKNFRDKNKPYTKSVATARSLRELRAAGFIAPEPLGVLHTKEGRVFLLTTHLKGKPTKGASVELWEKLVKSGFDANDLNEQNVRKTRKGEAIIDAGRFGPTDKEKLEKAIHANSQKAPKKKGPISKLFRKK